MKQNNDEAYARFIKGINSPAFKLMSYKNRNTNLFFKIFGLMISFSFGFLFLVIFFLY
jgi:hypothetical protein